METKTMSIRRYITLEFDEKDLLKLSEELQKVLAKIDEHNKSYKTRDDDSISTEKLKEFHNVINKATHDILKPVDYSAVQREHNSLLS